MGQIILNLFSGEWTVIFILTIIIFLALLMLLVGLCIGIYQGQNGMTKGMAAVVAAFLLERAYLLVAQSYVIHSKEISTLGGWRLLTIILMLLAFAYCIYEVIRNVVRTRRDRKI